MILTAQRMKLDRLPSNLYVNNNMQERTKTDIKLGEHEGNQIAWRNKWKRYQELRELEEIRTRRERENLAANLAKLTTAEIRAKINETRRLRNEAENERIKVVVLAILTDFKAKK